MARINGPAERLHAELVAAGIGLSVQQVTNSVANQIGPPDDSDDPQGHWAAIAAMRRGKTLRLPDADIVAMALASQGRFSNQLPHALRRFSAVVPAEIDTRCGRLTVAEAEAESFMSQRDTDGVDRDRTHGERLAKGLLEASAANGSQRGQVTTGLTERARKNSLSSPKERIGLEALGLTQAFATQMAEVGGGQPAVETIDKVDASIVTGSTPDQVQLTARWFDIPLDLDGSEWTASSIQPTRNFSWPLSKLRTRWPAYEQRVMAVGSEHQRLQVVAVFVPVVLAR